MRRGEAAAGDKMAFSQALHSTWQAPFAIAFVCLECHWPRLSVLHQPNPQDFSVLMTSLTPPTDPVVNPFDDVLVGDFADEFNEELKIDLTNAGTTLGCNNMSNLFCPTSPATRAHAAHFLVYELGIPIPTP